MQVWQEWQQFSWVDNVVAYQVLNGSLRCFRMLQDVEARHRSLDFVRIVKCSEYLLFRVKVTVPSTLDYGCL